MKIVAVVVQPLLCRRDLLGAGALVWPKREAWDTPERLVTIPLKRCGTMYCAEFTIDGEKGRSIVDTGSPFFNAKGPGAQLTCFDDTDEIFAGGSGKIKWRSGLVQIGALQRSMVYGIPDKRLRSGHGGLFLGLVKHRANGIRPTFLEQLPSVKAIALTFTDEGTLAFSRDPLIKHGGFPFLDLRRYGAPVQYYAAEITRIIANGVDRTADVRSAVDLDFDDDPISLQRRLLRRRRTVGTPNNRKRLIVIFDSGLTGIQLSRRLATELGPLRELAIDVNGIRFDASTKNNPRFLATPLDLPWDTENRLDVVVLGLAFLVGRRLVIDVDDNKMLIEDVPSVDGIAGGNLG